MPKAESLIHIFLPGGAAHQETWDPKPFAPIEYRGPLGTVDTTIPGVKFSQYMQNTAKIADKITVVRSMTHGEAAHERGTHNMFTGYRPSPGDPVSVDGLGRLARARLAQQPAALRLHSERAE